MLYIWQGDRLLLLGLLFLPHLDPYSRQSTTARQSRHNVTLAATSITRGKFLCSFPIYSGDFLMADSCDSWFRGEIITICRHHATRLVKMWFSSISTLPPFGSLYRNISTEHTNLSQAFLQLGHKRAWNLIRHHSPTINANQFLPLSTLLSLFSISMPDALEWGSNIYLPSYFFGARLCILVEVFCSFKKNESVYESNGDVIYIAIDTW